MELYHGSNIAVAQPFAFAGCRNLDFGRGFYTTRLKSQAQKWAPLWQVARNEIRRAL